MRFLVDEQLPPGLADKLVAIGHLAEHVHALGLGGASDDLVWRHATVHSATLITKDEDFVSRVRSDALGAVIWIRLGNTTNHALSAAIEPALPEIIAAVENGEKLIEVTT